MQSTLLALVTTTPHCHIVTRAIAVSDSDNDLLPGCCLRFDCLTQSNTFRIAFHYIVCPLSFVCIYYYFLVVFLSFIYVYIHYKRANVDALEYLGIICLLGTLELRVPILH